MSMIIDGTNGLTFNNATTQASAGSVLQVVQASYSTFTTSASTTYADTGLSASITPKFSTSKILVMISHCTYKANDTSTNGVAMNICRNGTQIVELAKRIGWTNTAIFTVDEISYQYLDSPSTTSSTTYKTQFANYTNTNNNGVQFDNMPATITLMEIAG